MENCEQTEGNNNDVLKDPFELMDRFYKSNNYQEGIENFYRNKTLSSDVTQKEKERVFLESDQAKIDFVNFCQNNVNFRYCPNNYPPRCVEAIKNYEELVIDINRKTREGFESGEEVVALDQLRNDYHQEAAKELARSGIVPSEKIGRGFAKSILAIKGLDTWENAKESDAEMLRRKLVV